MRNESSETEEIIEFSQTNPWKPQYSRNLVRRFLTELISSRTSIFDLHDQNGRVASAVLLDKVENPANDACLEILGVRAGANFADVLALFINLAGATVPNFRSGIQIAVPDGIELRVDFTALGLEEYYDTYEMNTEVGETSNFSEEITDAEVSSRDEIYHVLCRSFAKNPETSIPDSETWKRNFLSSSNSHFYIWKMEGAILGFANLVEDNDSAEVRTIGVLPQSRGLGIGNKLLLHCLRQAKKLGKTNCHLTVAVQNKNALGMYLRAGFKISAKYKCYRKLTSVLS